MGNCVFAHHAYGVLLPADDELNELIGEIEEFIAEGYDPWLPANQRDCDDDEELADTWEQAFQKTVLLEDRNAKLRKQFGVRSKLIRTHCVPSDTWSGSELAPGDLVFGLGVLAFPTSDSKLLKDLDTLTSQGAAWHSWVT